MRCDVRTHENMAAALVLALARRHSGRVSKLGICLLQVVDRCRYIAIADLIIAQLILVSSIIDFGRRASACRLFDGCKTHFVRHPVACLLFDVGINDGVSDTKRLQCFGNVGFLRGSLATGERRSADLG